METHDDDDEYIPRKYPRTDSPVDQCAICGTRGEVVKCKDFASWCTLLSTARLNNCQAIWQHSDATEVPDVYYHTSCRNTFSHKKKLQQLKWRDTDMTDQQSNPSSSAIYTSVSSRQDTAPTRNPVY
jgi:hypothetical protein